MHIIEFIVFLSWFCSVCIYIRNTEACLSPKRLNLMSLKISTFMKLNIENLKNVFLLSTANHVYLVRDTYNKCFAITNEVWIKHVEIIKGILDSKCPRNIKTLQMMLLPVGNRTWPLFKDVKARQKCWMTKHKCRFKPTLTQQNNYMDVIHKGLK